MANAEDSPLSIYASARSAAAMRTPDHMLTKVESSRIAVTDCSSGHILVVDDDPAVRYLISDYFGQHELTDPDPSPFANCDIVACYGGASLFDKHLASTIQCVDDEMIGWLQRL